MTRCGRRPIHWFLSRNVVVVNPVDYLLHDKISLRYLGLEDASVYAFKNKEGKATGTS